MRRQSVWSLMLISLLALGAGASSLARDNQPVPAEKRVGRTYWVRPAINEISVDFYKEPELRSRLPVYGKTRFRILDVVTGDGFPDPAILYKIRLQSGDEAYIGLKDFEGGLYAELRPNQVMQSDFTPPLGVGLHVYLFERRNIFTADPDVIWNRIKDDGPHFFRKLPPDDEKFYGTVPTSKP